MAYHQVNEDRVQVLLRFRPINNREKEWMKHHIVSDVVCKFEKDIDDDDDGYDDDHDDNNVMRFYTDIQVLKPQYTNVHSEHDEKSGNVNSKYNSSYTLTPRDSRDSYTRTPRSSRSQKKYGKYSPMLPSRNHRENESPRQSNRTNPDSRSLIQCNWHNHYHVDTFTFDKIFDPSTTQECFYNATGPDMLDCVLDGINVTILAYGQTGSGKTYTMSGPDPNKVDDENLTSAGIVPRFLHDLFDRIESRRNHKTTVRLSYVQIYMERIQDLIDPSLDDLKVRERVIHKQINDREVYIESCTEHEVSNASDVLQLLVVGNSNRVVHATDMNEHSSRSHSVIMLHVNQEVIETGEAIHSRLYFVDLAGSEQVKQSNVSGVALEQAKYINQSLSSLSLVIKELTDPKSKFIPYRNSKLTRILTDALGGNSRTILILNASPCLDSVWLTYSTLQFGKRAKNIKNKIHKNHSLSTNRMLNMVHQLQQANDKMDTKMQLFIKLLKKYGCEVDKYKLESIEDIEVLKSEIENLNNNQEQFGQWDAKLHETKTGIKREQDELKTVILEIDREQKHQKEDIGILLKQKENDHSHLEDSIRKTNKLLEDVTSDFLRKNEEIDRKIDEEYQILTQTQQKQAEDEHSIQQTKQLLEESKIECQLQNDKMRLELETRLNEQDQILTQTRQKQAEYEDGVQQTKQMLEDSKNEYQLQNGKMKLELETRLDQQDQRITQTQQKQAEDGHSIQQTKQMLEDSKIEYQLQNGKMKLELETRLEQQDQRITQTQQKQAEDEHSIQQTKQLLEESKIECQLQNDKMRLELETRLDEQGEKIKITQENLDSIREELHAKLQNSTVTNTDANDATGDNKDDDDDDDDDDDALGDIFDHEETQIDTPVPSLCFEPLDDPFIELGPVHYGTYTGEVVKIETGTFFIVKEFE
jgi:kinesin family protein 5